MGRWSDHVLVLRKGFKGQIPLQHTLMHVGMNLHITKDRLLNNWVGYPGSQLEDPRRETPPPPPELMGRARGQHAHGQDGGNLVEGRDEDADLTDAGSQEQGPCWLSICFAVAKDLGTEPPS